MVTRTGIELRSRHFADFRVFLQSPASPFIMRFNSFYSLTSFYKGDLSPFVETFLNIILAAEKQLLDTLTEKQQLYKNYYRCISSYPDKDLYDLLLQASLFSDKGIGYQDMIDCLHISLSTLKTKLGEIRPELLKKFKNKYVYYSLNLNELDKE